MGIIIKKIKPKRIMLYKRIIYSSKTNSDLGKSEKIEPLPMLIIKGQDLSKSVIKKSQLKLKIKNFPSGSILINHHENTLSSTIEAPCYTFDRDISGSYKCNQLVYDDKKMNEILFMKKKDTSYQSKKPKYPMKLKKNIRSVVQSHIMRKTLPKLTITTKKFVIKKTINFKNILLQNKLSSLAL